MEDLTERRTTARDYLRIIFKRKGIIISFFLGVVLVVTIGSFIQEPVYRAQTTILIEYPEEEPILTMKRFINRSTEETSIIQTQVEIIKSRTIVGRVVKTLNLDKKQERQKEPTLIIEIREFLKKILVSLKKEQDIDPFQKEVLVLQKNIKVTPTRKTDLIKISLEGKDPQEIAETTNVFAQTYIKYHFETRGTQRHTTFDFINEQVKITKQILIEADEKLRQFKEKEGITILEEDTIEDLRRLSRLKALLSIDLAGFTDQHPQVAKSKKEVQGLTARLDRLPEKELELARLSRAVANAEEIYLMLQKKLEEARISTAMEVERIASIRNIRVVDPAVIPLRPVRPKKLLNIILGCIIGMVGSLGLAFFAEYYDHTLGSPEDVKRYLNLPVLGVIPLLKKKEKFEQEQKAIRSKKKSKKLSVLFSKRAEAYRALRISIRRVNQDEPIQSVLITSANQQEGGTTVAVNLAWSLAKLGNKKVVLIDAGLHHPSVHTKFGLEQKSGLVDVLEGKIDLVAALKGTKLENLKVLTNGSLVSHPAELLESRKMKDIIKQLKFRFDIILFDSSPLGPFIDPIILGSEVDAVILVVRSNRTRREVIQHSQAVLEKFKSRILGVVLNCRRHYIPERIYRWL